MRAPIVLFTYRRPTHLQRLLRSLARCPEIGESELIVYCDAPKHGESKEVRDAVQEVRRIVHAIRGCGKLTVVERERNYGFQNLVLGLTEVLSTHDRAIVLEDDLEVAPGFLSYMNAALELYEKDDDVMHVSGYMLPLGNDLPPTLFYNAATCWGWGTWARAWRHFRDEPQQQLDAVARHPRRALFDCPPYFYTRQLEENATGQNKTWDGMWHASIFLRNGFCLHPGRSLVHNSGHDGTGENCVATPLFDTPLTEEPIAVRRIEKREWRGLRALIVTRYGLRAAPMARLRQAIARPMRAALGMAIDRLLPHLAPLRHADTQRLRGRVFESTIDPHAKLHAPYSFEESAIGAYSYVAEDATIKNTLIGRFTSIGPGFRSGFGLHPTDTVSTSPVFYSVHKQCGTTFSSNNKVADRKPIHIGNDVYIGMNVTVLDGVTIGDGAVVGAGAVVTKDIPPYAVAVGVPAKVVRWRFAPEIIERLRATQWWDGPVEVWHLLERHVLDPQAFLKAFEQPGNSERGKSP